MLASLRSLLAAALFVICAGASMADPVSLELDQARVLARDLLAAKQYEAARAVTRGLVQANPTDYSALIIMSRAEAELGRPSQAEWAARQAWALADTQDEKFAAAYQIAQTLDQGGRLTEAQWWLRRAATHAPNTRMKTATARAFATTKSKNPWTTELRFAVAPSSNINNGSIRTTTKLYDLPFDFQLTGAALALSGTEISVGATLGYRLAQTDRARHQFVLSTDHRTYRMSDKARALAPASKGRDFAFSSIAASYVRSGVDSELSFTAGRSWYARDPFTNFLRLNGRKSFSVGARAGLALGGAVEKQIGLGTRLDARVASSQLTYAILRDNGDRFSLGAHFTRSESSDLNLDYTRKAVTASYVVARPVLGMQLQFGITAGRKDHARTTLAAGGRHDREISGAITAAFPKLERLGFMPTLTIEQRRNRSNIAIHDTKETGIHLGIQSSF